jgi:putative membrane protein
MTHTRLVKILTFIFLTCGITAAVSIVAYFGFSDVMAALGAASWGIAVVAIFHVVPLVTDTVAWRWLLPPGHRKPIRELLWMRWVSESVNNLLPAAQVGGDLLRARLAAQRGVPAADAGASIMADITTSVFTLILFGAIGALLLFPSYGRESAAILIGLAIFAAMIIAFYFVQRAGVFSRLSGRAAALLGTKQWEALVGGAASLDRAIDAVYTRRRDVLMSCGWAFSSWVIGAGEVWLALYFLGSPVGLVDALIIESLIQAVRNAAFPIPGALGVQEGAFVMLGTALGISGETAVALSLVRRAREIIFGIPGLIVWQIAESRQLMRSI